MIARDGAPTRVNTKNHNGQDPGQRLKPSGTSFWRSHSHSSAHLLSLRGGRGGVGVILPVDGLGPAEDLGLLQLIGHGIHWIFHCARQKLQSRPLRCLLCKE